MIEKKHNMATYNIHNTTEEIKRNHKLGIMNPQVTEILQIPGNNTCVDCRAPGECFTPSPV